MALMVNYQSSSSQSKPAFLRWLNDIPTNILFIAGGIAFATYIWRHGLVSPFLLIGTIATLVGYQEIAKLFSSARKAQVQLEVVPIIICAAFLVTSWSAPTQAQFFGNAQTWMEQQFPQAGQGTVALMFNVLRGLFLLYLGISIVKVIQAQRQDDDWQNMARTPLIIFIAMTLGDILATTITG